MMPPHAVITNHLSGYLPEVLIRLAQALKKPVGASSMQLSDECLADQERVTADANGMFLIVKSVCTSHTALQEWEYQSSYRGPFVPWNRSSEL